MRSQFLWIALLAIWTGSVCAEPAKPIAVIEVSKSYSRGTFPRQGSWLGLYCNGSDCEIRDAAVEVTSSTARNVLDEDEPTDVLKIGKIDLLLTLPSDVCIYDGRLYLSSLATGQEFLRKATEFTGYEAACGC